MNDKTREQIEAMKMQTIGVEVEMNNITREKAARKVAEFFGTTAWYAAGEYGYMSWACKDQQGRVWKFQRDISIHGPEAEKCEMVTPHPYLRRHRDLAGNHPTAPKGWRKVQPQPGMRRSHPHRQGQPHPQDPAESGQHHGRPRRTDRQSDSHRCRQNRTVLPSGRPPIP